MPHSFLAELGLELLFRGICYVTGRVVLFLFAIPVQVEPFSQRKTQRLWSRDGFSYRRGGGRYLYTESVVFIGLMVWLLLALVAGLLWWLTRTPQ